MFPFQPFIATVHMPRTIEDEVQRLKLSTNKPKIQVNQYNITSTARPNNCNNQH